MGAERPPARPRSTAVRSVVRLKSVWSIPARWTPAERTFFCSSPENRIPGWIPSEMSRAFSFDCSWARVRCSVCGDRAPRSRMRARHQYRLRHPLCDFHRIRPDVSKKWSRSPAKRDEGWWSWTSTRALGTKTSSPGGSGRTMCSPSSYDRTGHDSKARRSSSPGRSVGFSANALSIECTEGNSHSVGAGDTQGGIRFELRFCPGFTGGS